MGNGIDSNSGQAWDAAWSWIMRQHERDHFDATAQAELSQWLQAHPSHREAYDKASRLWQLAGLVPPANDIDIPDCPPSDGN